MSSSFRLALLSTGNLKPTATLSCVRLPLGFGVLETTRYADDHEVFVGEDHVALVKETYFGVELEEQVVRGLAASQLDADHSFYS